MDPRRYLFERVKDDPASLARLATLFPDDDALLVKIWSRTPEVLTCEQRHRLYRTTQPGRWILTDSSPNPMLSELIEAALSDERCAELVPVVLTYIQGSAPVPMTRAAALQVLKGNPTDDAIVTDAITVILDGGGWPDDIEVSAATTVSRVLTADTRLPASARLEAAVFAPSVYWLIHRDGIIEALGPSASPTQWEYIDDRVERWQTELQVHTGHDSTVLFQIWHTGTPTSSRFDQALDPAVLIGQMADAEHLTAVWRSRTSGNTIDLAKAGLRAPGCHIDTATEMLKTLDGPALKEVHGAIADSAHAKGNPPWVAAHADTVTALLRSMGEASRERLLKEVYALEPRHRGDVLRAVLSSASVRHIQPLLERLNADEMYEYVPARFTLNPNITFGEGEAARSQCLQLALARLDALSERASGAELLLAQVPTTNRSWATLIDATLSAMT